MNRDVYLNLMHRILYSLKFRNNESYDHYTDIVFSPLYVELFSTIREEMFSNSQDPELRTKMNGALKDNPDEYERVKALIKGTDFSGDLSEEVKKELIGIIVFPFSIDQEVEAHLLNLFPS